jgi:hypothetical protein
VVGGTPRLAGNAVRTSVPVLLCAQAMPETETKDLFVVQTPLGFSVRSVPAIGQQSSPSTPTSQTVSLTYKQRYERPRRYGKAVGIPRSSCSIVQMADMDGGSSRWQSTKAETVS